jgi:hypothetical protein
MIVPTVDWFALLLPLALAPNTSVPAARDRWRSRGGRTSAELQNGAEPRVADAPS